MPSHTDQPKHALTGYPLDLNHPASIALLGAPIEPGGRNPVRYLDLPEIDTIPLDSTPLIPSAIRPAWLMVWNPALADGLDATPEAAAAIQAGRPIRDRWSTGSRRSGIQVGDRVFLLAVGPDAGIVASGWAVSPIHTDRHWMAEREGEEAAYVFADWDTVVDLEGRLDREALRQHLPDAPGQWIPRGGGIELPFAVANTLSRLWAEHLQRPEVAAPIRGGTGISSLDDPLIDPLDDTTGEPSAPGPDVRTPGSPTQAPSPPEAARLTGQGRELDQARRTAIENAAQTRLEDHYRAQGWDVSDVRYGGYGCDAIAMRADEVVYLEAKGTRSNGARLIVTAAEVNLARDKGATALGVWSGMRLDANNVVDPDSGEFTVIYPWDPDAGLLEPTEYRWAALPTAPSPS